MSASIMATRRPSRPTTHQMAYMKAPVVSGDLESSGQKKKLTNISAAPKTRAHTKDDDLELDSVVKWTWRELMAAFHLFSAPHSTFTHLTASGVKYSNHLLLMY